MVEENGRFSSTVYRHLYDARFGSLFDTFSSQVGGEREGRWNGVQRGQDFVELGT